MAVFGAASGALAINPNENGNPNETIVEDIKNSDTAAKPPDNLVIASLTNSVIIDEQNDMKPSNATLVSFSGAFVSNENAVPTGIPATFTETFISDAATKSSISITDVSSSGPGNAHPVGSKAITTGVKRVATQPKVVKRKRTRRVDQFKLKSDFLLDENSNDSDIDESNGVRFSHKIATFNALSFMMFHFHFIYFSV